MFYSTYYFFPEDNPERDALYGFLPPKRSVSSPNVSKQVSDKINFFFIFIYLLALKAEK